MSYREPPAGHGSSCGLQSCCFQFCSFAVCHFNAGRLFCVAYAYPTRPPRALVDQLSAAAASFPIAVCLPFASRCCPLKRRAGPPEQRGWVARSMPPRLSSVAAAAAQPKQSPFDGCPYQLHLSLLASLGSQVDRCASMRCCSRRCNQPTVLSIVSMLVTTAIACTAGLAMLSLQKHLASLGSQVDRCASMRCCSRQWRRGSTFPESLAEPTKQCTCCCLLFAVGPQELPTLENLPCNAC